MAELREAQPCEAQLGDFSKALSDTMWPAGEATRSKRDGRVKLAVKNLASHMARAAAKSVENRRDRAKIKTEIYTQLTTLLETVSLRERELQQFYTRIIALLCGSFAVVLMAIVLAG